MVGLKKNQIYISSFSSDIHYPGTGTSNLFSNNQSNLFSYSSSWFPNSLIWLSYSLSWFSISLPTVRVAPDWSVVPPQGSIIPPACLSSVQVVGHDEGRDQADLTDMNSDEKVFSLGKLSAFFVPNMRVFKKKPFYFTTSDSIFF